MSTGKTIGYVRDAGCVLVGLGGIVYQIATGHTDATLLTVCMALLGITGGLNVRQLRPPSTSGGRGSSSSSQQPDSSSRTSSPPSQPQDGEV